MPQTEEGKLRLDEETQKRLQEENQAGEREEEKAGEAQGRSAGRRRGCLWLCQSAGALPGIRLELLSGF